MRRLLAIATPIAGLFVFTWAQTFFSAAAVVAVPACSSVDAAPLGEITGIEVLSDTLTAGHGCGPGPNQIYKYISVVTVPGTLPVDAEKTDAGKTDAGVTDAEATDARVTDSGEIDSGEFDAGVTNGSPGEYLSGASTDCFANATFINLCTYDKNPSALNQNEYDVTVYAFTQDQWNLVETDAGVLSTDITNDNTTAITINTAASNGQNYCGVTTSIPLPSLTGQLLGSANWVTHCEAIQQSDIPVLAQCGPLVQLR